MRRYRSLVLVTAISIITLGLTSGCPPITPPSSPCFGDPCDDGLFCNGIETCTVDGSEAVCSDGTPVYCEGGWCDPVERVCVVWCLRDDDCPTNFMCVDEYCDRFSCQSDGDCWGDMLCGPDWWCASRPCDSQSDCRDGWICPEGLCTVDYCYKDSECRTGYFCDDSWCAPEEPSCSGCTDDGQFCNGTESCVDGQCRSSGDPCDSGQACDEVNDTCPRPDCESCDDNDFCTTDTCVAGVCTYRAVNCDDGLFCTGVETCDAATGCASPGDPCDSGQTCDEVNDRCPAGCEGTDSCRVLPSCFRPGVSFTVTIEVTPPAGTLVYGVEDSPPSGWSVSNSSDDGEWDATNGVVKWFFLDDDERTLTYTVTPTGSATGDACFDGQVNFDGGTNQSVGNDACLSECP